MNNLSIVYPAFDVQAFILAKKLAFDSSHYGIQCTLVSDDDTILWQHCERIAIIGQINAKQLSQLTPFTDKITALDEKEIQSGNAYDILLQKGITGIHQTDTSKTDQTTTSDKPLSFVAITACPTGVAHTFMSAEALTSVAQELGYSIKVETQGSVGAKNILNDNDIQQADFVILATDIEVNTDRFDGKKVYRTSTSLALKQTKQTFQNTIDHATTHRTHQNNHSKTNPTPQKTGIYKHLMTGVSFMLPIVVAGGLLIALSFVFGIKAFEVEGSLAAALMQTGKAAFTLMIPILSGYIAYSIADRAGLTAGLIGGLLSAQLGAGFLGAIVAGFLAGYVARFLVKKLHLPQTMEALKPILIVPLLSALVVGLLMFYAVGSPVAYLLSAMENFLASLSTGNLVLLGAILGAMMCVDMGGPINKAAYTFAVGLLTLDNPNQFPIAAAMAGGMVPAIGMGVATLVAKQKFSLDEQNAGKASFVLGLCFISEGAIPFAAKDPSRVLPACIIGGASAGGLVGLLGATLAAPHGGIFVLLIPNAINKPLLYLLAVVIGSLITGVMYALIKPKLVDKSPQTTLVVS